MKRSQMLDLIHEVLCDPACKYDGLIEPMLGYATDILVVIEKAGVRPPIWWESGVCTICTYERKSWEPEE